MALRYGILGFGRILFAVWTISAALWHIAFLAAQAMELKELAVVPVTMAARTHRMHRKHVRTARVRVREDLFANTAVPCTMLLPVVQAEVVDILELDDAVAATAAEMAG